MLCCKTVIDLRKAKTFYLFNVLPYLRQLKTVKEKLLSNFVMKHFEHCIIKLLKFGKYDYSHHNREFSLIHFATTGQVLKPENKTFYYSHKALTTYYFNLFRVFDYVFKLNTKFCMIRFCSQQHLNNLNDRQLYITILFKSILNRQLFYWIIRTGTKYKDMGCQHVILYPTSLTSI